MKSRREKATGQPTDRRNREAEILQAALEIFARKGYAAASIQDVADAVGVLKGSLYHYIDSKEDLLFQIFDNAHVDAERLMTELDALEVDAVERLRSYLERSVSNTLQNLELQTLYFRDWRNLTGERRKKLVERRRQYDHYLRGLITKAYESLGIESTVNQRYVSSFVIGGTNWVADWYRSDGDDSPDEVARSYAQLAMATVLGIAQPAEALTAQAASREGQ
ncbi:TetR/AcrR family transcriptional regulator [Frankia sp. AiPs1]|uniref:TetR/AcrR family transcriptional regulator n=1 Tax=Frankia sp. AiPs1 TaxID=573493 RepID=UPI002043E5C8|nr:TetR/AcrR family transcriptional regulator [Frankia sp. AiPs1]MCM3921153.1 TetR/AcrR family transcriptional regulator [Frankia sp. AiPs1]